MSNIGYTTIASPHIMSLALTRSLPNISFLFHIRFSSFKGDPKRQKSFHYPSNHPPRNITSFLSQDNNPPQPPFVPKKMPPYPTPGFGPYSHLSFSPSPSPPRPLPGHLAEHQDLYNVPNRLINDMAAPSGKPSSISRASSAMEDSVPWNPRQRVGNCMR